VGSITRKWIRPQHSTAFFFILPAVILFAFFSWRPIFYGLWLSFLEYHSPLLPPKFVGLKNFRFILQDPLFYRSWKNTLIFIGLGILIGYFLPVILAIAINEIRRNTAIFRLGFYLPVIIPLVVVILVWKFLYYPEEGLFDSIFKLIGLSPVRWLLNEKTAMLALVIMSTWKNAGATMIIYLAALQGVPSQLYEAAEIDGASIWHRLRHITIPQIMPIMLIIFILQVIGTAQVFVEPFIMTGGGPHNATLTVLLQVYNTAFRYYNFGLASAINLTLFVFLVAFTGVYFIIVRKLRHE